ncbi:hypothetical protein LTR64_003500 [Lithohypha guttulata]|uniref:uncharacterized protein n=1 Tax=Lithohypha guttulata TaxID=1690604 RepID=UPI00315D77C6
MGIFSGAVDPAQRYLEVGLRVIVLRSTSQMNQFRPHTIPRPTFEGYYSKFDLPSGGRLALIICSVPQAKTRPHMVSFTYIPPDYPDVPLFQKEIWAEDIQMVNIDNDMLAKLGFSTSPKHKVVFELRVPNVGTMKVYDDDTTEYDISDPERSFSFSASIAGGSGRTPWSRGSKSSTPEGMLVYLPLPLHWHVHSLASTCNFRLSIPSDLYSHLHPLDTSNTTTSIVRPPSQQLAYVHQEKNWAHSFPASHIWIQARNHTTNSGVNVAGGGIIGTDAFLISYHGTDSLHDVSFTPPYAMQASSSLPWPLSIASSYSPTCTCSVSWADRQAHLEVSSLTRKISIVASAPKDTFFGLSAPFHDGHRKNFLGQSFRAKIKVKVFKADRLGLGHWNLMCEEVFENGSLEFGADWYGHPDKGETNPL